MFEEIIMQLDSMGVQYTEDYEMGSLTVDVGALDKVSLISVIQLANDSGMEFTVDETSLVITGGGPAELPMEEPMPEGEDELAGMQEAALGELF